MRTSDATKQSSHRRTSAFLVAHQIQTEFIRDGGLREGQSYSTHGGRGRIRQYARNLSLHDDEVASMNSSPASSLDGKVFTVIPPEVLKAHRRDTEAADGVEAAALRALSGIRACHQSHRTHPRAGSGRRPPGLADAGDVGLVRPHNRAAPSRGTELRMALARPRQLCHRRADPVPAQPAGRAAWAAPGRGHRLSARRTAWPSSADWRRAMRDRDRAASCRPATHRSRSAAVRAARM